MHNAECHKHKEQETLYIYYKLQGGKQSAYKHNNWYSKKKGTFRTFNSSDKYDNADMYTWLYFKRENIM